MNIWDINMLLLLCCVISFLIYQVILNPHTTLQYMEPNNPKRSYVKWSDEDKALLMQLVQQQKMTSPQTSWISIANVLKNKSPRQCYDQWLQLSKRGNDEPKHVWKQSELEVLELGMQEFGQHYEQIQLKYLPDVLVSEIKAKCHYLQKMQKKKRKQAFNIESASNSVVSSVMSSFMSEMSVATSNQYCDPAVHRDDVAVVNAGNTLTGPNFGAPNNTYEQDDDFFLDIMDLHNIL